MKKSLIIVIIMLAFVSLVVMQPSVQAQSTTSTPTLNCGEPGPTGQRLCIQISTPTLNCGEPGPTGQRLCIQISTPTLNCGEPGPSGQRLCVSISTPTK